MPSTGTGNRAVLHGLSSSNCEVNSCGGAIDAGSRWRMVRRLLGTGLVDTSESSAFAEASQINIGKHSRHRQKGRWPSQIAIFPTPRTRVLSGGFHPLASAAISLPRRELRSIRLRSDIDGPCHCLDQNATEID
jgi:hypothetical protein